MSYTDIVDRTWQKNHLLSALVELTYRCNLNCFFCYNALNLIGAPLSTAQYIRFFEDLRDLGALNLTFSGGEPLARADFFTLGRQARELGFVVKIKSNGHALNGRLARRLAQEVAPFLVEISLHGACAETHDRQTRMPGSFNKLRTNLRELLALGLRLKLNSPLTAWNESEMEAMYRLADEWDLPIQFDAQITPRDDGDPGPLQVAPSRAAVVRLLEFQRQRTATRRTDTKEAPVAENAGPDKHCGAGSSTITVDPFGNVYPCVQWRRRVGNLHEQSIQTIWRQSSALTEVRRLAAEVKQTVYQHYSSQAFGFCPGLAEQETGHPDQLYPAARLRLELHQHLEKQASPLPPR